MNRAEVTLASLEKLQQSHMAYLGNRNGRCQVWRRQIGWVPIAPNSVFIFVCFCFLVDASGLLRSVTQFSHLAADTIVNTAATSHSAPTDQADRT